MSLTNTQEIVRNNQARKVDAKALAELIYDIFKEKKRKENDKIVMEQNNAQSTSTD